MFNNHMIILLLFNAMKIILLFSLDNNNIDNHLNKLPVKMVLISNFQLILIPVKYNRKTYDIIILIYQ